MNKVLSTLAVAVITSFSMPSLASQNLTFTDVFDFKTAKNTQLTEDGRFLALSATPYRGDPQGIVYDLTSNKPLAAIENGNGELASKLTLQHITGARATALADAKKKDSN